MLHSNPASTPPTPVAHPKRDHAVAGVRTADPRHAMADPSKQRHSGLREPSTDALRTSIAGFTDWLARYGETSWDHQSYFAGPIGGRAKALYYRSPKLG